MASARRARSHGSSEVPTIQSWVGSYRLESRIGVGGFGQVWTALDIRSSDRVALKLIPYRLEQDVYVLDEVRAAQALDHPHIVRLLDHGRDRATSYIAMQWIRGGSIAEWATEVLQAGRQISESAVRLILRAVASALDHAFHEATLAGIPVRLVHRDVSPQNILVDSDGTVVLTDFGVAKSSVQEHRTAPQVLRGKPAYMSPEQVRREPLDVRSDYFSLGTICWEMLAGRRLFKVRESSASTMQRVLNHLPPPIGELRPDVSYAMVRTVHALLEKDANRRPARSHDILGLLGGDASDEEAGRSELCAWARRRGEERLDETPPSEDTRLIPHLSSELSAAPSPKAGRTRSSLAPAVAAVGWLGSAAVWATVWPLTLRPSPGHETTVEPSGPPLAPADVSQNPPSPRGRPSAPSVVAAPHPRAKPSDGASAPAAPPSTREPGPRRRRSPSDSSGPEGLQGSRASSGRSRTAKTQMTPSIAADGNREPETGPAPSPTSLFALFRELKRRGVAVDDLAIEFAQLQPDDEGGRAALRAKLLQRLERAP